MHPNASAKSDPTNKVLLNKGVVIKEGTPEEIRNITNTTNLRDAFFELIGGVSNEE